MSFQILEIARAMSCNPRVKREPRGSPKPCSRLDWASPLPPHPMQLKHDSGVHLHVMSTWPRCDQAASEGRVHSPGCCPHHRGLELSVSKAEHYGVTVLKALLPPMEASEEWLSCERRVPSPGPSLLGSKPPPKPR